MKIQLNTELKTIKIEESVNLGEFFEKINQLFPDDLWKEYKLEVGVLYDWGHPIIIKEPYPVYPTYPWYPLITHGGSHTLTIGGTTVKEAGTSLGHSYNVDI